MNVRVEGATASLAAPIASLIMEAMNHECCQNLAGKDHTIEDFRRVMTELVALDDSQYSYRNTLWLASVYLMMEVSCIVCVVVS